MSVSGIYYWSGLVRHSNSVDAVLGYTMFYLTSKSCSILPLLVLVLYKSSTAEHFHKVFTLEEGKFLGPSIIFFIFLQSIIWLFTVSKAELTER